MIALAKDILDIQGGIKMLATLIWDLVQFNLQSFNHWCSSLWPSQLWSQLFVDLVVGVVVIGYCSRSSSS